MTETQKRYDVLDGLRGVAAVGVLIYHFGTRLGAPVLVSHGYLAVDFFFILSGFVIAHSYTNKFPLLSWRSFVAIRAKRLLPLSIVGVFMGTGYLLLRWKVQPALSDDIAQLFSASALNAILIPKFWLAKATKDELFPANGVLWSLCLEMIVTLIWAAAFVRSRIIFYIALATIGAITLSISVKIHGNADIGWGWGTFIGGAGRAVFGFFTGIVLWHLRLRLLGGPTVAWASMLALIAVLCAPVYDWRFDVVSITVLFPIIILFSATSEIIWGKFVFKFLGELSYPLYAVHLPFLMAFSGLMKSLLPGHHLNYWCYLLVIPILYIAQLFGTHYDVPVRAWLNRRNKPPQLTTAGASGS